ncbi:7254_t:CDS:2 [Funneliformis geosporum]|uniref:6935_t:CDS:1 n=1 Tax=Funneliformis geosporum TaxID=1117311 RepID=A0A9W4SPD6_9GLOM|nr:7254_t:CDS:2 [Funneliformis geosporum]CAI2176693.1 6935_t:CDS:2 [Funneliformis geosporum]
MNVVKEESISIVEKQQESSLNDLSATLIPTTTPSSSSKTKTTVTTSTSNIINKDTIETEHDDVLIRVGEQPDLKKFRANSKLLSNKCSYFRTALSSNWARKEDDVFIIEKPNIRPKVFGVILNYIYKGTVDWKILEGEDFLGVWLAADEFMLDDLERQIRELFEKKSEMLKKNFMKIVRLVYQNETLERFRSNCVDIINTTTWFQESSNFGTLEESIFQSLLSEEEHYVHDGVMWNLLILWASSSKKPILNSSKVMEWTDEKFELLKSRMDHFVHFIRFSLISRNDFYDYVLPYKRILPADTTNNAALQYYLYCLDEGGNPKLDVLRPHVILNDSKIVNHTHVAMVGRWIDIGREKEVYVSDSSSTNNNGYHVISTDEHLSLNEEQANSSSNATISLSTEATKNSNSRNEEKGSTKLSWKQPSSLRKLWTLRKGRRPVFHHDSSSTSSTTATVKKENSNDKIQVPSSSTHIDAKRISSSSRTSHSKHLSTIFSSSTFTYHFQLIYRGSRDGFDTRSYYNKCSGQGATVVVTTMSHSRIILGGYYPINTESRYPMEVFSGSSEAFIFSFGEGDNPEEDAILSRVLKEYSHKAICRTIYGPGFGENDLSINLSGNNHSKMGVCNKNFYEKKIIEPNTFTFDEIEVFSVTREAT